MVNLTATDGRPLDISVVEFTSPDCQAEFTITAANGGALTASCDGRQVSRDLPLRLAAGTHRLLLPANVPLSKVKVLALPDEH